MKTHLRSLSLVFILLTLLIVSQSLVAQGIYNVESSVPLTIRVHNISGLKMPQSGGTIKVILYDENYNHVKHGSNYYSGGESYISVSLGTVSPANYIIEVYNEPNTGFAYSEFWGSDFIQADGNAKDFYRHVPYVIDVRTNGKSVYDVLTTTTVEKTVEMKILVKNPDPYTKKVKVRLMLRKQGTNNIWFNSVSSKKSISASGVESFIFYPKPQEKGLHEFYVIVYDWNEANIITDQHDWYRAFYTRYPHVHLTSRTTDGFNDLGSITFDGIKYCLPEDIDVSPGTYTATANDPSGANAGYEFYRWETSGGVSVSSTTSRSVTVTVRDDGTLRAVFVPPVYLTSIADGQQDIGTITFDGVTYDLPARVAKYSPATYWATANPPIGYIFVRWETYQGISVEDPYSQTTKVHVDGAGTLKAVFQQQIISLVVTNIHTDKSEYTLQDNIVFSFTVENTGTETVTYRPVLKVRAPNGEEFTAGPSGIQPDIDTLSPGQTSSFSSSKQASLWYSQWGAGRYDWGVILIDAESGSTIYTDTGYVGSFSIKSPAVIRSKAEAIIKKLKPIYGEFKDELLNTGWWTSKGDELASEAAEPIEKALLAPYEDLIIATLPEIVQVTANAISLGETVITVTKQLSSLIGAIRCHLIAGHMATYPYPQVYEKLSKLYQNTKQIEEASNANDYDKLSELFRERKMLLEELYGMFPEYIDKVYWDIISSPSSALIPGTYENVYQTIRIIISNLRHHLMVDYYATTAWINDAKSDMRLSMVVDAPLPTHSLYYSQKWARFYDTLDNLGDYTIYRITVTPEDAGDDKHLLLRLVAPQIEGFDAYLTYGLKPDPNNPTGIELEYEDERQCLEIELTPTQGDYYLLVKARTGEEGKIGDYIMLATIRKPGWFISSDYKAPIVTAEEKTTVLYPKPKVKSIVVSPSPTIRLGESLDITIKVENLGNPASWQSIAISLPNTTDVSSISILDHNLDEVEVYEPGFKAGAKYGTAFVELRYPLIEGSATNWEKGSEKYLKVRVRPDREGRFLIYVKSVAFGSGVWVSAPAMGETNYVDQQLEYVFVKEIIVEPCSTKAKTYTVVRGMDNKIYYRSYSGNDWESWQMLPGSTIDSPAAIECGGKLHIVVRGGSNTIWYGRIELSTGSFSGWKKLPGATLSKPDLAATADCKLYLAVRGMDDGIYLNYYDGSSWTGWRRIPGSTVDGPSIAILGDTLHMIVRGSDGFSIWHGTMDLTSSTWQGWTKISGSTPSTPDLAVDQAANILYLAVRGANSKIYIRFWSMGSWGDWEQLPSGATPNGPAITISEQKLHIMVEGFSPPNSIYHRIKDLSTNTWSRWNRIDGATPSKPEIT